MMLFILGELFDCDTWSRGDYDGAFGVLSEPNCARGRVVKP